MTEGTAYLDERARIAAEIWAGLSRPQPELSPKWFYDAAGSALFDEITRLPEYYPTRTERAILRAFGPTWFDEIGPRSLVELGAGSADKTRILLDALHRPGSVYVPVDISTSYLDQVARELEREYPDLDVVPARSDISRSLDVPAALPGPTVFAFLGSTIGNFGRAAAVRLLARIRAAMRTGDRLLLGVDLVKDTAILEAAYNDSRGVTAAFNRNVLHVLNRMVGTDFVPDDWEHLAFFNAEDSRIEMHLRASTQQRVGVPGRGTLRFDAGATIRTEISCKYDRAAVSSLFADAGLVMERWVPDARDWFALVTARSER
jgi:L-histidine Nalpha-methyltransferase